jgi:hypothetical protein
MFFTNAFQNFSFIVYFIKLIATSFHQNASLGSSLREHRSKLVNIKHVFQNNAYVLCRYNTPVWSEEIRYPHTNTNLNIYRFSVLSKLG